MRRLRKSLEDWEEWLRPYVEKKEFSRRKNQYDAGKTKSCCYSVGCVPFGLMAGNDVSRYVKWDVSGTCERCGAEFVSAWNNMWLRKAGRGLEVCGRCARKEQFTEEWRRKNAEAQKKAQGTPEAKARMSVVLRISWANDPERRVRVSRSLRARYEGNDELRRRIGDASRRNWRRPEYQEKVSGHGYHHGWFVGRNGRLYFASSWELMFLVWCDGCEDVLSVGRNNDAIRYEKPCGMDAFYHPDFDVEVGCGRIVVEVKGGRSELDLVERKRVAAERFYRGSRDYVILYKEDLRRMGIFKESRTVGKWVEGLVARGKVEGYGFGKKHSCVQAQG